MDAKYIRDRITELRLKKNVSEYQMSTDLGQNKGYIQAISSGKALPSMAQFLRICDYFEMTPLQFFDSEAVNPQLPHRAMEGMRRLSEVICILCYYSKRAQRPCCPCALSVTRSVACKKLFALFPSIQLLSWR